MAGACSAQFVQDLGVRALFGILQATILHQIGMNHRDLVCSHDGRNERLTDEYSALVVTEIPGS